MCLFLCVMETGFDVKSFITNLTNKSLISCKRGELLVVAGRLKLSHP